MKCRIVTSVDQRLSSPASERFQQLALSAGMKCVLDVIKCLHLFKMQPDRFGQEYAKEFGRTGHKCFRAYSHEYCIMQEMVKKATIIACVITPIVAMNQSLHLELQVELRRKKRDLGKCLFLFSMDGDGGFVACIITPKGADEYPDPLNTIPDGQSAIHRG